MGIPAAQCAGTLPLTCRPCDRSAAECPRTESLGATLGMASARDAWGSLASMGRALPRSEVTSTGTPPHPGSAACWKNRPGDMPAASSTLPLCMCVAGMLLKITVVPATGGGGGAAGRGGVNINVGG